MKVKLYRLFNKTINVHEFIQIKPVKQERVLNRKTTKTTNRECRPSPNPRNQLHSRRGALLLNN